MSDISKKMQEAAAATAALYDLVTNGFDVAVSDASRRAEFLAKMDVLFSLGANVDLGMNIGGKRPIWLDKLKGKDYIFSNANSTHPSQKERQQFLIEVTDRLTSHSKNILVEGSDNVFKGAAHNEIFGLNNIEGAATAVIQAIKESYLQGDEYKIPLLQIYAGIGFEDDLEGGIRQERKDKILQIHARVGERLSAPQRTLDTDVAEMLSDEGAAYWLSPFVFPDLKKLPVPTKEMYEAIKGFGEAASKMTEPRAGTESKGEAFDRRENLRRAEERIESLKNEGKASRIVRQPKG